MLKHAFVPSDFCGGIIVPLLKHKHGDATQLEMYRGITLVHVLSKLYELVLLRLYEQHLASDPLQFGFRRRAVAFMRCSLSTRLLCTVPDRKVIKCFVVF